VKNSGLTTTKDYDPVNDPDYSLDLEQDLVNRNVRQKDVGGPIPPHGVHSMKTRRHVGPHDDEGLQRLISTGQILYYH